MRAMPDDRPASLNIAMILITTRAHEVAAWIEEVCAAPSSYTIAGAWALDTVGFELTRGVMREIELKLTNVDQLLFDLRWAGCFIENPDRGRWYDNTETNRAIMALKRLGPTFEP